MLIRQLVPAFFLSLIPFKMVVAQQVTADTASQLSPKTGFVKSSLFPLPIVYFTPETGWAGGVALFAAFRMPGQTAIERASQLQIGFAYTQQKQFLFYLPYQFFWDKERNQAYGELGYYRYVYQFFGIGNNTAFVDRENYQVTFPRLRFNFLRQLRAHQYLGLRYWWDNYNISAVQPDGLLEKGNITGNEGGVISGAGLLYNFDSRDNIFYPTKGFWVEAELFFNQKILGSTFDFSRWTLDAVSYTPFSTRDVLAVNVWLTAAQGDVPFQQLAFIGGPKKMRGYFEGRLRDKSLWMAQVEYRRLLGKRWGAVAFAGIGAVGPKPSDLFAQKTHAVIGTGLRFRISKKERVHLRLDAAINEFGAFATYLTLKEAF